MDRYAGASEANNLQWAAEQANELLFYQEQFATALLSYADRLDAFVLAASDGRRDPHYRFGQRFHQLPAAADDPRAFRPGNRRREIDWLD